MCTGPGPIRVSSKHHEVGVPALGDPAPVADAVQARLHVGDEVDRLLEREQAALHHGLVQHRGRVVERRQHVEVRAGVGCADHRPRIAPHVDPQLPRLVVVARGRRHEHGAELVGEHDVERARRTGPGPARPRPRRRSGRRSPRCRGRRSRRPSCAPSAPGRRSRPPPATRPRPSGACARRGRRAARIFSSGGSAIVGRPAGQGVEHEPGLEREVDPHHVGHGQRQHPRAARRRPGPTPRAGSRARRAGPS